MEDIEQAADRLRTAADTMQLLISDIDNNNNFSDVISISNETLTKVRNLIDQLQRYRNSWSGVFNENAYSSPTEATGQGPGRQRYVIAEEQIRFLRELHFLWEKIADLLGISESILRRRRSIYGMNWGREAKLDPDFR